MSTPFRDDQSAVTLTGYGCAVEKLLLLARDLPSPCGACKGVLPFTMRRMQRGKLPFEPRPQTSSGGAQRRPVASSGASLPSPCGGCTGVLSFTMRRMQRGSPLSTPPANEQRRCAEKTSRIFRAQVCLHHAEAAEGFSHSACG